MTYYILYTYVIPISLFISMEVVRVIQAVFIFWDEQLTFPHPVSGELVHTMTRNSNLNDELGNVDYVFSDKTGTLTRNIMLLSKWFVAGKLFDELAHPGAFGEALKVP